MKVLKNDILTFFKTMLMVLGLVCTLSACSTSKSDGDVAIIDAELTGEESDLDEQQRSCWQAELLAGFYDAMAASSLRAYPKVTKSAMPFMMVAFAVWLSFRILRHISSVVEESPAEVWTEVARMAFVCLVCGLFASSESLLFFVLNKIIFPIYYAFLEYGSEVLAALGPDADVGGYADSNFCIVYTNSFTCKLPTPSELSMNAASGYFPTAPSEMMQCLTCATSDRLHLGFTIGSTLMTMNSLTADLCGLILFAIFAIVKVAFVFYMVDSIFRMNIMIILLPCFILAYPFKFTRKWTKIGFLSILNSAAIIAFMAILISMALLAMQYILIDNSDLIANRDNFVDFGVIPLSLILVAFLILKSIGISVALAGSIIGVESATDFQKKIASLAAQVGKRLFSFVSGGVGKLLMRSQSVQRIKEAKDKMKERLNQWAGRS